MLIKSIEIFSSNKNEPMSIPLTLHTVFHSSDNSTGKTTLMRGLLYALGFEMPSTTGVNFDKYSYVIHIFDNIENKTLIIKREKKEISINGETYYLPLDFNKIISRIFKIENEAVINNLLPLIYFEQDMGWTMINRGTTLGFKFDSLSLLNGFNNLDFTTEKKRIELLNREIEKYKNIINLSIRSKDINQEFYSEEENNNIDNLKTAQSMLISLQNKIGILKSRLKAVNSKIKDNSNFSDYVEKMNLKVTFNKVTIPVNKNTLNDFGDIQSILFERKNQLISDINELEVEYNKIDKKIKIYNEFLGIERSANVFLEKLEGINTNAVEIIIDRLLKEKEILEEKIKDSSNSTNIWIPKFWNEFKRICEKTNIPSSFYRTDKLLYMKSRKGISGTILHEISLCYRLALIRVFKYKYKINLPVFFDSPSGREIKTSTIDELYKIINDELCDNQIIISTINNVESFFGNDFSKIIMNRQFFN